MAAVGRRAIRPAGRRRLRRARAPVPPTRRDRGSVTAELALGLPAVVLAVVLVMLVSSAAIAQVRCTDAARAGARAAALGEDEATVLAIVADLAGEQAEVSIEQSGGWVEVQVQRPVAVGWLGTGLLTARAEFSVPVEPGDP